MLQKVILVFPSLHQLWRFVKEARMNYLKWYLQLLKAAMKIDIAGIALFCFLSFTFLTTIIPRFLSFPYFQAVK